MTDELASVLVNPSHVEYAEWKDENTGETILTYSKTGAKVLEPGSTIMNVVMTQIEQCLATASPDLVGKLDYDSHSTQGIASWCVGNSCYESCRFRLN